MWSGDRIPATRTSRRGVSAALLLACCAATSGATAADQTATFRQGVSGYAGTEDLHIAIPADFMGNGHLAAQFSTDPDNPVFAWDYADVTGHEWVRLASGVTRVGWGDEMGLLRFRDVFGDAPGQVPPGAEIVSATLKVRPSVDPFLKSVGFAPGDGANLHEVLVDWDETVRWNSFGPAPGPDMGTDYDDQIVVHTGVPLNLLNLDVTSSLQRWSDDPSTNKGWIFAPVGTQDIVRPSGSAISNVNHVTVDLEIDTPDRAELVVTLRHGDYTALLLNRLRNECLEDQIRTSAAHLDLTIDDDAPVDIHFASSGAVPLRGTYQPDSYCVSLPLCTGGGTAGLCGQSADGDWVLTVTDEWGNYSENAVLQSWTLHLSDGVTSEQYTRTPGKSIEERHLGSAFNSNIWSSEAPIEDDRPLLEVTYREAPRFEPSVVDALSGAGNIGVTLHIPAGSNAAGDVSVGVTSDTPAVAQALNSPVVFAQGGATSQTLQLQVASAGAAKLTASNDAGLPNAFLRVNASALPIVISPDPIHRSAADPDEVVSVTIPYGSNTGGVVDLTVTSSNTAVFDLEGGTAGSLALQFAAGASNSQAVTLSYVGAGAASLDASDDAATITAASAAVTLSTGPAVSYDVHVAPYIQLGDPAPGAPSDQLLIVWQTLLRRAQGPDSDHFSVEYRPLGGPSWLPGPPASLDEVASTSQLNHVATLTGLAYDSEYEYRIVHHRNGVPLPGGTYQDAVRTRKTGAFNFTAVGNTGAGSAVAERSADRLALIDPDLHFFLGDFNYYIGENEHMRPRVFDVYGDAMSSVNSFFVLGNHEEVTDNGEATLAHAYTTHNGPPEHLEGTNYSFDVGDVHFTVVRGSGAVDVENVTGPWVAADLASSSKPWKIVVTHEPGFTADPYGVDRPFYEFSRDHLLKAAVDGGANLFLAGATHSFQSYLPITSVDPQALAPDPIVEWATCTAGQGVTLVHAGGGATAKPPGGPIPGILDPPMQTYIVEVGLQTISIDGDTLTAEVVDLDGNVLHSLSIDNCQNPANCVCPVCGDGTAEAPEECDDGNTLDGDGCSFDCQDDYQQDVTDAPLGGVWNITLEGVEVSVVLTVGQTRTEVLDMLIAAINGSGELGGVYALAQGYTLVTNGFIDDFVADETGGIHKPGTNVPALGPLAWAALLALLAGGGLARLRS